MDETCASGGVTAEVKLRSASPAVPARIFVDGQVRFAEPQFGVAPGQACVFYRGGRVIGGGFIAASLAPFPFDRIYGHYFDRVIATGAKEVMARSVARYLAAIAGTARGPME